MNDRRVTLGVWDTAGSERYESLTKHYYQGADAAIICYDLADAKSWARVAHWHQQVTEVEPDCIICIVGNKLDLVQGGRNKQPRGTKKDVVAEFVDQISANYFESSAKDGIGVAEPFKTAAAEWLKKPREEMDIYDPAVNIVAAPSQGGCCS